MRTLTLLLSFLITSCSYLRFSSEDKPSEIVTVPIAKIIPPALNSADLELRFAKLWGRVDELENHIIRQRERIKLLEKGLLLGLMPEELKNENASLTELGQRKKTSEGEELATSASEENAKTSAPITSEKAELKNEKSQDITEYRRLLQNAQDKFSAGNYGQSIVSFNDISERFDDSMTEGNHHYWIGLSWFYLKEYQLAETSFRKIIEKYNQNSWVPLSRFYLAKIDLNRGLTGRARDQLKLLIDEYPNQDLSEMARMELDKMREKL